MIRELNSSEGLLVTFGAKTTMITETDLSSGKIAVDLHSLRAPVVGIPDVSDIVGFSPKIRMTFTSAASVDSLLEVLLSVQQEFRSRAASSLAQTLERGI